MDPTDIQAAIDAAKALGIDFKGNGGWSIAGIAVALTGIIRLWQLPAWQRVIVSVLDRVDRLSPTVGLRLNWLVWDRLTPLGQWAVPVVGAMLAGVALVLTGQASWGAAAIGVVAVAVGAIGTHHTTKFAGAVAAPVTSRLPAPMRAAASIALPIPREWMPAPVEPDSVKP